MTQSRDNATSMREEIEKMTLVKFKYDLNVQNLVVRYPLSVTER